MHRTFLAAAAALFALPAWAQQAPAPAAGPSPTLDAVKQRSNLEDEMVKTLGEASF